MGKILDLIKLAASKIPQQTLRFLEMPALDYDYIKKDKHRHFR